MNAPQPCRAASILPPPAPHKVKLDPDPDETEYAAFMAKTCAHKIRISAEGRPNTRWDQIMRLMSDGRERTYEDVNRATGMGRDNARVQLGHMVKKGVLIADKRHDIQIYRRP